MDYHTLSKIVEYTQIWVNQFIIKFNLFFSQFMIVSIDLIDELSIKVYELLEFLFKKATHTLIFSLLDLLITFSPYSTSQISVYWLIWIHFKDRIWFFSREAAIFASTYLSNIRTSPWIIFLYIVEDVILVDENKTV